MKRLKFILAIESYLIRKGISSVLNRIPEVHIIKEVDRASLLEDLLSSQSPDFIIICETIFNSSTSFYLQHPSLVDISILVSKDTVSEKYQDVKEIIFLSENKEQINKKIEKLLTPFLQHPNDPGQSELSEREKTIVKYVASGLTNKEIADKLFLSAHTVITHRKNISRKLNIKSVSGLTVYAIVNNIIRIDEISGPNPGTFPQ